MRQRGRKSAASLAVIGSQPRLIASNPARSSLKPPAPPEHLGDPERLIWNNVVAEYEGARGPLGCSIRIASSNERTSFSAARACFSPARWEQKAKRQRGFIK